MELATRSTFSAISLLLLAQTLSAQPLEVCVDYHCEKTQNVELSDSDFKYISQLLHTPALSSQLERRKISLTIGRFEVVIGKKTPTGNDLEENKGADAIGQLDCISESLNTQQYLKLLYDKKLITHHTISDRQRRVKAFIFDHWSAFLTDIKTNKKYAVDSWHYKNGQPAVIQTEADWLSHKRADNKIIP